MYEVNRYARGSQICSWIHLMESLFNLLGENDWGKAVPPRVTTAVEACKPWEMNIGVHPIERRGVNVRNSTIKPKANNQATRESDTYKDINSEQGYRTETLIVLVAEVRPWVHTKGTVHLYRCEGSLETSTNFTQECLHFLPMYSTRPRRAKQSYFFVAYLAPSVEVVIRRAIHISDISVQ